MRIVTARPETGAALSRAWLRRRGFPPRPVTFTDEKVAAAWALGATPAVQDTPRHALRYAAAGIARLQLQDRVSAMLRQCGEFCQGALQTIGDGATGDRMDPRFGLSTKILRGIAVITDTLRATKPRDILRPYRSAQRPPSRTFAMMFRELEPKIQKTYLDTVSEAHEILVMLADKAATAATAVCRETATRAPSPPHPGSPPLASASPERRKRGNRG